MYVDESGGTDEAVTTEEMTVTVDGEDYDAELNFDYDSDGVNETALIREPDGSARAFVDTDADGAGDQYVQLDAEGQVVAEAAYDEASGDWVATEPGPADTSDKDTEDTVETQTSSAAPMAAELPGGETAVGPATVDTDHDGRNDTAMVSDEPGNTYYFTDVDGDGDADVAVVIDPDGAATALEHQGRGEWVETGTPGTEAQPLPDDPAWGDDPACQVVEGVVKIDATTGLWISQN